MSKPLESCPLCETEASVTKLNQGPSKPIYNISCGVLDDGSDSCGLVFFGGTDRKAIVKRWNTRKKPL